MTKPITPPPTTAMTRPLTPPDELLEQWYWTGKLGNWQNALTLAYRAGADQELEACCKQVAEWQEHWECKDERLRADRRPKPPSLKEEALKQLDEISTCFRVTHMGDIVCDKIRAALEALPND